MNGAGNGHQQGAVGTFRVKAGLAQMLKGGVIMGGYAHAAACCRLTDGRTDAQRKSVWLSHTRPFPPHGLDPTHIPLPFPPDVVNVEQAKIAEEAGAVAVMALERIPADIRRDGGVARMSDPAMIKEIKAAVTIPVMAKVRHE